MRVFILSLILAGANFVNAQGVVVLGERALESVNATCSSESYYTNGETFESQHDSFYFEYYCSDRYDILDVKSNRNGTYLLVVQCTKQELTTPSPYLGKLDAILAIPSEVKNYGSVSTRHVWIKRAVLQMTTKSLNVSTVMRRWVRGKARKLPKNEKFIPLQTNDSCQLKTGLDLEGTKNRLIKGLEENHRQYDEYGRKR